ncbi:MAG TPA: hypothetical protein VN698_00340, partial [Bacteroidia bacterium]|nr:hypothetical protein [Bacteroidia bacterium]
MKKLLTLLLIACFTKQVNAQIITTVAGNFAGNGNAANAYGDGGQATAAGIGYPFAGTFDAVGNMYIVDVGNYIIRKVNTNGIISTIAGNYTSGYN